MRHRRLLFILLSIAALRLVYLYFTPFSLSPDEAHYWEWSRRLDLSYYSKGPLVAYVIALFTKLLGSTDFAVRAGAVVFSTLSSYALYLFGREVFESEETGFWAALLPNALPIFSIGSILMTTDVLLVFFWTVALYSLKKALDTYRDWWWWLAGILTGAGIMAKYTMAFIYPSLLLVLLASRKERSWLLRYEPYVALAISLAVSAPVIYWNVNHGMVTMRHTLGQAHLGEGEYSIRPALEFILSQAALMTPLLFAGLVYGIFKAGADGVRERRGELLLVFFSSVTVFLFFLLKSLHGKVQANWAIVSYMTAIPASVWAFSSLYENIEGAIKKALAATAAVGIIMGISASILAYFPQALEKIGMERVLDGPPYNRVTGWRELGARITEVKETLDKKGNTFIISDTYQITSELAFYTKGNPVAYNVNTGSRRMNQYDLWPGFADLLGYNAIYVKGGNTEAEPIVTDAFDECEKELFTIYRNGKSLKWFSIFKCYNFKGIAEPPLAGGF